MILGTGNDCLVYETAHKGLLVHQKGFSGTNLGNINVQVLMIINLTMLTKQ